MSIYQRIIKKLAINAGFYIVPHGTLEAWGKQSLTHAAKAAKFDKINAYLAFGKYSGMSKQLNDCICEIREFNNL